MHRRGRPKFPDILTPREVEVLDLIRRGLSNREIADRLGLSLSGAKFHVSEIISKLEVASREEAAKWRPERISPRHVVMAPFGLATRGLRTLVLASPVALRALPILLVIALMILALQVHRSDPSQTGSTTTQSRAASSEGIEVDQPVSLSGELIEQRGSVFILDAGPSPLDPTAPYGRPRFFVGPDTAVFGPSGTAEFPGGVSAIKQGDLLVVSGAREADGSVRAKAVTVSSVFNRHGMVTEVGPAFIDLRLQSGSAPFGWDVTPTRFKIDPQAQMVRLKLSELAANALSSPVRPEALRPEALSVGLGVTLMGTIAQDGTPIAKYVLFADGG